MRMSSEHEQSKVPEQCNRGENWWQARIETAFSYYAVIVIRDI
jgi:hypothetical protein